MSDIGMYECWSCHKNKLWETDELAILWGCSRTGRISISIIKFLLLLLIQHHSHFIILTSKTIVPSHRNIVSEISRIFSLSNLNRTRRPKYLSISFQNEGHPHRRNRLHWHRSPPPSPPSPLHYNPRRPLPPRPIPSHHPPKTPGHNPRRFRHLPPGSPHPA